MFDLSIYRAFSASLMHGIAKSLVAEDKSVDWMAWIAAQQN